MREANEPPRGKGLGRYNRAVMLLASALGLWVVLQAILGSGNGLDFRELAEAAPLLAKGLGLTAYISFVTVLLGSVIAAAFVVGLTTPWRPLNRAVVAWCTAGLVFSRSQKYSSTRWSPWSVSTRGIFCATGGLGWGTASGA